MPHWIDGIPHYTKAEIDQFFTGGYVGSLANRNALPISIQAGTWTQQSGGAQDGWYYADCSHGRNTPFACIVAVTGSDAPLIEVTDGTNFIQRVQSSTVIRLWIYEEPAYDLLCLVVYA